MAYPQATINMSKGMTQEQMWREVVEAPMPQPGITSVVVEHGTGENIPEPQPSLGDDFSERVSPRQSTMSACSSSYLAKHTS